MVPDQASKGQGHLLSCSGQLKNNLNDPFNHGKAGKTIIFGEIFTSECFPAIMHHICSSFYESTIANQDQVGCFQSLHIGSSFSAVVLHQVACIVFSYRMYDDTG